VYLRRSNAGILAFEFFSSRHFKYPTLRLVLIFLGEKIFAVLYVLLVCRPIYTSVKLF